MPTYLTKFSSPLQLAINAYPYNIDVNRSLQVRVVNDKESTISPRRQNIRKVKCNDDRMPEKACVYFAHSVRSRSSHTRNTQDLSIQQIFVNKDYLHDFP